jgi:hypothetical protein
LKRGGLQAAKADDAIAASGIADGQSKLRRFSALKVDMAMITSAMI